MAQGMVNQRWAFLAAFAGPGVVSQVECRVDQRNMREGLGEIAEHSLAPGVVLFREQTDAVSQREQPLEEGFCVAYPANGPEAAHHPEATG